MQIIDIGYIYIGVFFFIFTDVVHSFICERREKYKLRFFWNEIFKQIISFSNHLDNNVTLAFSFVPGLKKVFPCLACGKVLCSKASLKRHVADKHASRQEEYRCAICERVYCSRNSLMTHIYTYHKTRPTMLLPPPPHHALPPPTTHSDVKF